MTSALSYFASNTPASRPLPITHEHLQLCQKLSVKKQTVTQEWAGHTVNEQAGRLITLIPKSLILFLKAKLFIQKPYMHALVMISYYSYYCQWWYINLQDKQTRSRTMNVWLPFDCWTLLTICKMCICLNQIKCKLGPTPNHKTHSHCKAYLRPPAFINLLFTFSLSSFLLQKSVFYYLPF